LHGIDGLDICSFIKKDKNTMHLPVIMISASPGVKALAMHAGAKGFIEKPFTKQELLQEIDRCLNTP
jgi:CheY-like chemotaxis protein